MNKYLVMAAGFLAALDLKLDSAQTMVFARQLEHIETTIYETKYIGLKARTLVPVDTSVPPGAQTVTYRMWDYYGMAKIVANFADDIPMVDAVAREFTSKIKTIADGYRYSIEDLQAAAMAGIPLDTTLGTIARRVIEAGIDAVAAFGIPEAGMPGLLNHPNIPIVTPDTGDWYNASTSPTEILADLNKLVNSIVNVTSEIEQPDTLLLPTSLFTYLSTLLIGDNAERTVLRVFLENSPYIKNIDSWNKLETAGLDGGPRILAYRRAKDVLDMVISQEFTQLPPQAVNLAFKIPCMAKCGGVRVRYPLALAYMDGVVDLTP